MDAPVDAETAAGPSEVTPCQEAPRRRTAVIVLAVAVVWLAMRLVFWVGFAGADDLVYTYYAHTLDRPPIDHREFRIPAVLAIRGAMAVLGPSEGAACVPPMLASLAVALAAAWLVGWPRRSGWIETGTMLLVSMLPIQVAFASYPAAPQLAAGLLAIGVACVLRGGPVARAVGPVVLTLGFMTHEVSFFFIALFFLAGLAVDRRRFLRPALTTALLALLGLAAEAAAYQLVVGDWLARWRVAGAEVDRTFLDPMRFGGDPVGFFLWPIKALLLSKQFGPDLVLTVVLGPLSWRRLDSSRRVLLATVFLVWLWLGYGSQVPWAYRPRTRAFHYYLPLALPVAVLLPGLLADLFRRRIRWFRATLAALLAAHLLSLGAGGRWGQTVEVSRQLLDFTVAHPDDLFVADVHTLNEMTCLNGFRRPANVGWVPSRLAADKILTVRGRVAGRTDGPGAPLADYILVNHERTGGRPDLAFQAYLADRRGELVWRLPQRVKPLFRPLTALAGSRPFFVLSRGAEVVAATPVDPSARPPG